MTERLYHADSYLTSFYAEVVAVRSVDERVAVVLSRTAFYPTSGGQPHDLGTLAGEEVTDVREEDGTIVHVVAHPVAGRVLGVIDWPRRFDHMQQHTGQHILSQAALRARGAQTRSVHFGADRCTLDLDLADLTADEAAAVEDLANGIVFEDRPVHIREVDESDLPALGLRRPAKKEGRIRIVEVEAFDRSACGGTHVRRTGEVGAIKIRRWERHKGGIRLEFLCGRRALRDYRVTSRLVADLAASLTVAEADVPAAVARVVTQLRVQERTAAELRDQALAGEAAGLLAAASGAVKLVSAVLPKSPEDAALLAGRLTAGASCVAIIGAEAGRIIVARSSGIDLDARAILRRALEPHGGRGGGRPEFAQGAVPADRVAGAVQAARDDVAAHLRRGEH
jgi:alanyl-tRNA synthetase